MHSTEFLPANILFTSFLVVYLTFFFITAQRAFHKFGVRKKRIINMNRGWRKLYSRNYSVKRSKN